MNPNLRITRPPTLTQMAVDQLRDAIVSGRFQPGQRLVEMDLSESFGVSRAPLREAFRILAGEGLIEIKQNRGCTVVNPSLQELEQMLLFRALIEGTAARLITARQDQIALDRLTVLHQTMVGCRKMKNNLPFLDAYWEFHRSLVLLTGNSLLIQSWNAIGAMLRIFMSRSYSHFEDRREIINTLEGFLRCFRAGDAARAETVVRSMMIWMGHTLLDTLIPQDVAGYVTHVIGPNANVMAIDAEQLAARRKPNPSAAESAVATIGTRSKIRQRGITTQAL